MSQSQMDVRPAVQTMPLQGFHIQTGGSARRRIIRPTVKQTSTTQFPIQTHYKVSGIPGHTHNASVVCSVLCDLHRTRQHEEKANEHLWSHTTMTLQEGFPTDSEFIKDTDARLERALERGIGEICLRPENCHDEIREPVRSISELRTLVAPDDRLQCLTYVEEVGGFVNVDQRSARTTPYISDYPDVMINILGVQDPNRKELPAAPYSAGPAPVTAPANAANFYDYPRLKRKGTEDTLDGVFLHRANGDNIGTLPDGSPWNGIVKFRWNASTRTYQSEGFDVTINRFHEVTFVGGTSQYTTLNEPNLQLYVNPMETTVASGGSCFLAADGLTNTQLLTSVNAPTNAGVGNAFAMKPKIKVSVRSALPSRTIAEWELIGTPAVRIMVGGVHAFYGVSEANVYSYLRRAAATVSPDTITQLFGRVKGAGFPVDATGFTDYRLKYTGTVADGFGRAMIDQVSKHPSLPIFSSPMNLEPAAPFFGINMSFQDNVNIGYHLDYTPARQPPSQFVLNMGDQAQLDAATSTFDGVVVSTALSQNKLDYAPSNLDPNLPAYSDDAGMVPNVNSVDYFWITIDQYDHGAAMTSSDPEGNRVQHSSNCNFLPGAL